jgi:hypothetical protein
MIPIGTVLAERFGQGGLAWVAAAWDQELQCDVALKVLLPNHASHPVVRERFKREVSLSRRLTSPAIVRAFELYEHGPWLFFTMELCAGVNLKQHLRLVGPLPASQRRQVAETLLGALAVAHGVGIVHRDIKPQNVMRLPDGSVRLLDFGLARVETMASLTSQSMMLGTPEYLAPEAIVGLAVDGRADLYALGVLLFELATGELPLSGRSALELMRRKSEEDGPAPTGADVDAQEAAFVARLLRCDPADRFASAGEALASLLSPQPDTVLVAPPQLCIRCGTESSGGPRFCLACGAGSAQEALSGGQALLVLNRADDDLKILADILASVGARPIKTAPPLDLALHLPVVLLRDADETVARGLQEALMRRRFVTEVRLRHENNFDLLHRRGTPGVLLVLGLFGGWLSLAGLAFFVLGTLTACAVLVAGPPLGWVVQTRADLFLAPLFEGGTQPLDPTQAKLAAAWRRVLAEEPPASLLSLGAGLLRRTHALLGTGDVDLLKDPLVDGVITALEKLVEMAPRERALQRTDPRRLWEQVAAAETRALMALSPETRAMESQRASDLRDELHTHMAQEEQRAEEIQRVLRLCATLETMRRELSGTDPGPDPVSVARQRLEKEMALLVKTQAELDALEAG